MINFWKIGLLLCLVFLQACGVEIIELEVGDPPGGGDPPPGSTPPPGVFSFCDPLPDASGNIIRVTSSEADNLPQIIRNAPSGTTVLLESGTYLMSGSGEANRRISFNTPNITLRSVSNNAEDVILDGEYITREIISIYASNTTIAHITLKRAYHHPIHISPPNGVMVTDTLLYGLRIIDGGQQFVKVNSNGQRNAFVDDGTLACSYFEMTDPGRQRVRQINGSCYTGGIDTHFGMGWIVENNYFKNIYCTSGLAEHAVHFWSNSRDTLVQNNVIINCARGIGFGLGQTGNTRNYADNPYPGISYIGHIDGMIRNNVIYASNNYYDTGIEVAQARGAKIYHNTVISEPGISGFFTSISYRFSNTLADIRNNLARRISRRDGASATLSNNFSSDPFSMDLFVDVSSFDFHLNSDAVEAIDAGTDLSGESGLDMDGDNHDKNAPDLGADEFTD